MPQQYVDDKPLSSSGRFGRLSYLAWVFLSALLFILISSIGSAIFFRLFNQQQSQSLTFIAIILLAIVYVVFIYFYIVFTIRRLHDRNHSGWLCLLMFVPGVNFFFGLYILLAKGNSNSNSFGPVRKTQNWEKILGWINIILFPFMIVIAAAVILPAYQDYVMQAKQAQYQQLHQQNYSQYSDSGTQK